MVCRGARYVLFPTSRAERDALTRDGGASPQGASDVSVGVLINLHIDTTLVCRIGAAQDSLKVKKGLE